MNTARIQRRGTLQDGVTDQETSQPVALAGGHAPSANDWDAAAATVLRKTRRLPVDAPDENAWATLARTTAEGIQIPPLGTPDRLAARGGAFPIPAPASSTGRAEFGWDVRSLVADPEPTTANAAAVNDLENGVTSLWLTVGGTGTAPADLSTVLDGVFLQMAPIVVQCAGGITEPQATAELERVLDARGIRLCSGSNLGADAIGRAVRSAASPIDRRTLFARIAEIVPPAMRLGACLGGGCSAGEGDGGGDLRCLGEGVRPAYRGDPDDQWGVPGRGREFPEGPSGTGSHE